MRVLISYGKPESDERRTLDLAASEVGLMFFIARPVASSRLASVWK